MKTPSLPLFPLTAALFDLPLSYHPLEEGFSSEVIPLGTLSVKSGHLVVGDPLLGMALHSNPFFQLPPGSYAVALTRVLRHTALAAPLPAYLSLVLDAYALDQRVQSQKENLALGRGVGIDVSNIKFLTLDEEARLVEHDDSEMVEQEIKSGVVGMVDAQAFQGRMPNPLHTPGGWYEKFFQHRAPGSWLAQLDDPYHLEEGVANIELPTGPDDWVDGMHRPTIVLAQMLSPGQAPVFVEYSQHDERQLSPIALHVDLGFSRFWGAQIL